MKRLLYFLMSLVLLLTSLTGCGSKGETSTTKETCLASNLFTEYSNFKAIKYDRIREEISIHTSRKKTAKNDGKSHKDKTILLKLDTTLYDDFSETVIKATATKGDTITTNGQIADIVRNDKIVYVDFSKAVKAISDDDKFATILNVASKKKGQVDCDEFFAALNSQIEEVKYSKLDGVNKNAVYHTLSTLRLLLESNKEFRDNLIEEIEEKSSDDNSVQYKDNSITISSELLKKALDELANNSKFSEENDKYSLAENMLNEFNKMSDEFDIKLSVSKNHDSFRIDIENISLHPDYETDISIVITPDQQQHKIDAAHKKLIKSVLEEDSKDITDSLKKMLNAYLVYKKQPKETKESQTTAGSVKPSSSYNDYDEDYDDDDYDYDDDDDWDDDDDEDYDDCDDDDFDGGYEPTEQRTNSSYYDRNID